MHTRIAVLLSLAILIGLLAGAETRWLVASDLLALFRPESYDSVDALIGRPAEGDFEEALAALVYPPLQYDASTGLALSAADRVRHLQGLAARFPNRPALYAAVANLGMSGVQLYEPDQCLIADGVCNYPPLKNDPFLVKALLSDTEAACRLEPDNGYFAALEAYACFNAGRNSDALAAFTRAASCTDWNEHEAEPFRGAARMLPWVKRPDAIAIDYILESQPAWESAGMRGLMRRILAIAVKAELHGNYAEGARLRRIIRRVGSLMRDKSRTYRGANVGTVFVAAANRRLRGKSDDYPGDVETLIFEANSAAAFLETHGYEADAADVQREAALNRQARSVLKASDPGDLHDISRLIFDRCRLRFVEMMALLLGIWAIAAGALLRSPSMRARSPLSRPVAQGIGLAIAVSAVLSLGVLVLASLSITQRSEITYRDVARTCLIAFFVLTAGFVYLGRRPVASADAPTREHPSRFDGRALATFAASLLAVLSAFCGLLALASAETRLFTVLRSLLQDDRAASGAWDASPGTQLLLAASAVPFLIAVVAAVAARVKRRPAAVAILLSWRAALPWIVCALVAAYAVLAVPAAKLNDRTCSLVYQRATDEPRAMARREGAAWPVR